MRGFWPLDLDLRAQGKGLRRSNLERPSEIGRPGRIGRVGAARLAGTPCSAAARGRELAGVAKPALQGAIKDRVWPWIIVFARVIHWRPQGGDSGLGA